jgi:hypothetical protein
MKSTDQMRRCWNRWSLRLRRYRRRLPLTAGASLIVGVGMAAFAFPLDQSPLVLGPIAGIGAFLIILHYG